MHRGWRNRRHRGMHGGWDHAERERWAGDWRPRGRTMFLRFIVAFGMVVLLAVSGIAVLAFLVTRLFGGDGHTAVLVWIVGVGLVFGLPVLGVMMAVRAFGRIVMPLSDVMSAAERVAEGDLTARVQQRRGGFGRLASSFNGMVEELERTDQLRRNLTTDVAHELRTPLHVIQGNLEGVNDGVYEPTPEHIQATLDEIKVLGRLVDDLGVLSLAESGQLSTTIESVVVDDLLAGVAEAFANEANEKGVALEVDASGHDASDRGPLAAQADVVRMQQVLGNLVVNAVRHTPTGGRVLLSGRAAGNETLIEVSDTGEGIAAEDLPFVFERFWHRQQHGSGLGLAIAQRFVQVQEGRIEVSSEIGVGTTFSIWLPAS